MADAPRMQRRTFIKAAAALPFVACSSDEGSAPLTGSDSGPGAGDVSVEPDVEPPPTWSPEAVPEDGDTFPTGVLAGAMTADAALVRATTTAGSARLKVWQQTPAGALMPVVDHEVTAHEGHLLADLTSLAPGATWGYAFFTGPADAPDARSAIGQFRTPPAAPATPVLTLGATVCTKYWFAPYAALQRLAQEPLDAVCHLGDMSYNDEAQTLPEYREAWRATLQDPGYRALLPAAGLYMTWDDHEIANNDWSTLPAEQLAAGKQAFFEALPVPRGGGDRLWGSYRWGHTAEIFVLDCRSERQPATRGSDAPIYISVEQMTWLKQALSDSPCRFKVIMTSVPITRMTDEWPTEDTWLGYAPQRDELLDHITAGIDGVVFLAGDYHFGAVTRVEATGPRANLREILVGPGGSSPNPLVGFVEVSPSLAELYVPAEQFDYYSTSHAATVLTFDPAAGTLHVRFIDPASDALLHESTLQV